MPKTLTTGKLLEGVAVWLAYGVFAALPVGIASALGGMLLRLLGPLLPSHTVARANLLRALPELAHEHKKILSRMWDNLGRTMAEYAHLQCFGGGRVEIIGGDHVKDVTASGKTAIFFAGHLANWEVPAMAVRTCGPKPEGLELALVYRAPNNRLVDTLIRRARLPVTGTLLPKGGEGAKGLIQLIRQGQSIGMLVDQKMNNGLAVPFFGQDAMTAAAMVTLAQKYGVKLYPVHCMRTSGARFRVTIHPPLTLPSTGDATNDTLAAMTGVNALIESWIRENPAQWLWVHRRWPNT